MTLNPNDPHELAHAARNQLALIAGQASVLKMSPNLTPMETEALGSITRAVEVITQQLGQLVELADQARPITDTTNGAAS